MVRTQWMVGSVLAMLVAIAYADGRGYEARTVTVNAGVVVFGSNDAYARDLYTFYVMERRSDLKPLGLVFRNPFAPTRDANNRPVTRNHALYWQVDVARLNDSQLARYHILLLSRTSWDGMTLEIREKLRRFVDGGGTLWIDVPSQGTGGRLWFPEVELSSASGAVNVVNLNHPLLRGYYVLSPAEVARLGLRGRGFSAATLDIRANRPVLQVVTAVGEAPVIAAVTYGSGRIVVSAAGIAAAMNAPLSPTGDIVPEAPELAMEAVPELELKFAYNLVRWAGAGTREAFNQRRANAVAEQYGAPLGIRWRVQGGGYTQRSGSAVVYGGLVFVVRGNELICYDAVPRRDLDGDGRADDGALDFERGEMFDCVWRVSLRTQRVSPPVVVENPQGIQVVVATDEGVEAYWALPRGAGGRVPDTGQQAWSISAPVVLGRNLPHLVRGGYPAPVVVDNALLLVPLSYQAGTRVTAGFYAVLLSNPPRVVTSAGVPFGEWIQPHPNGGSSIGEWILPPVAGYVPNLGQGGGNDFVVYFGVRDAVGTDAHVEGVRALWIGAKGEILEPIVRNGVFQNAFRSRITGHARFFANPDGTADLSNPLHPRAYLIDRATGAVIEEVTEQCLFNVGPQNQVAQGQVFIRGSLPRDVTRDAALVIDYYIDWGYVRGDARALFRTYATLPSYSTTSPTVPPQRLQGYTLAPNGILYITTGTEETDPDRANGNIIALQEQSAVFTQGGGGGTQARSGSRVLWRWQSHGGYKQPIPGQGLQEVTVPASTIYREPNETFMRLAANLLDFRHSAAASLGGNQARQWMNFTFRHAPIYYDGAVYAIGEGEFRVGPFSRPYTVLVALDAEPGLFVVPVGAPIGYSDNFRVSLQQRDYARSGANPINNVSSVLSYEARNPIPDVKVDFATGQIRIESFARGDPATGRINLIDNVLSISQPVVVSFGTPQINSTFVPKDQLLNWDNLRWYGVLLLGKPIVQPVVVGDNVYMPMLFVNPIQVSQTFVGMMALAADPYPLQPDLPQRQAQAGVIPRASLQNPLRYRSIVRWPYVDDLGAQFEGGDLDLPALFELLYNRFAENFEQGSDASSIAVGEGLMLVSIAGELRAYSRQSTIIADENRLVEVDTAGRVVWSTENTQLDVYTGSRVPSKLRYALTPNARVYRYSENEFLVVEPERNRVVIIDRAGSEVRTITRFIPDQVVLRDEATGQVTGVVNLRAAGAFSSNYYSGAPETLRNPTDVTVWTEFVPAARNPFAEHRELEYWIHYTITDAGNARVVDIVDRYEVDPRTFTVGGPVRHSQLGEMLGVLYWMTPSQRLGRNYRYVAAQRFEYWDGSQTRIGFVTVVQNLAEGAFEATGTLDPLDPSTPHAGMLTIQLVVNGRDQTLFIRRMRLPDGKAVPILGPVAIDVSKRSASGQGPTGLYLLLTTSTGIYELQVPLSGNIGDTLPVTWMLPSEVFATNVRTQISGQDLVLRPDGTPEYPILLRARQARYLDNGNVLVVNAYEGETRVLVRREGNTVVAEPRAYFGEVFEIKGADYDPQAEGLGFKYSSIVWSTLDNPEMSGSYSLRKPSSADRGGF